MGAARRVLVAPRRIRLDEPDAILDSARLRLGAVHAELLFDALGAPRRLSRRVQRQVVVPRLARQVQQAARAREDGQPAELRVALVVADDDGARHAKQVEDVQLVTRHRPSHVGRHQLHLVLPPRDAAVGPHHERRVV
eukprot:5036541-Prymnesium_polylepis.1